MYLKKHNRYFAFQFKDAKSLTSLKYQIDENRSIANTFFENIKEFLEIAPDAECRYTAANGLRYSQRDLEFLIEKLKFNVMLFNKKSHVFRLMQIDEKLLQLDLNSNLNELLNLLHGDFEANMNDLQLKYPKLSTIPDYRDIYLHLSEVLNTINNTIHEIEGTFNNYHNLNKQQYYEGFYSTCLMDNRGWTGPEIELKNEDYNEFTLEQFFGQLSIGYNTTGKNLIHAYWTNDLKVVKERKITPQTSCTSNVLLYFKSSDTTSKELYDKFVKWYDRHNLSQYGYSKTISTQALGNITLGKLKYIDREEIELSSLNLKDKLSIVDRIKNKILKIYFPLVF